MTDMEMPDEWIVLDSRAQYDVDVASVFEACGRSRPSWRKLRELWGGQGAVLAKCTGWDGKVYTQTIVVGVIK